MSNNNRPPQTGNISRYFTWKSLIFLSLPILLNIINEIMELLHFNTFNGSPGDELIANVSFYMGNWPSLFLKMYPYVLSTDNEVVYEVSGWMKPMAFIVNLLGWGLVGFISSYILRKSKRRAKSI